MYRGESLVILKKIEIALDCLNYNKSEECKEMLSSLYNFVNEREDIREDV